MSQDRAAARSFHALEIAEADFGDAFWRRLDMRTPATQRILNASNAVTSIGKASPLGGFHRTCRLLERHRDCAVAWFPLNSVLVVVAANFWK
jgi:hypothetical protein